jgi:hypothetical protein
MGRGAEHPDRGEKKGSNRTLLASRAGGREVRREREKVETLMAATASASGGGRAPASPASMPSSSASSSTSATIYEEGAGQIRGLRGRGQW